MSYIHSLYSPLGCSLCSINRNDSGDIIGAFINCKFTIVNQDHAKNDEHTLNTMNTVSVVKVFFQLILLTLHTKTINSSFN